MSSLPALFAACLGERESERGGEREGGRSEGGREESGREDEVRDRDSERVRVLVCVYERVSVCVRERESVCVCV